MEAPARIERFRGALCGPLGSCGDRLVWAGWLPFCSLVALVTYGFGVGALGVVVALLLRPQLIVADGDHIWIYTAADGSSAWLWEIELEVMGSGIVDTQRVQLDNTLNAASIDPANAAHLANDLLYGVDKPAGRGLRVNALSANTAVVTCLANDTTYAEIYAQQLVALASLPGRNAPPNAPVDMLEVIFGGEDDECFCRGKNAADHYKYEQAGMGT